MTFFITSTGTGKGADFGGLEGADQHCQALAGKVGAGHRTWRAYLSNSLSPGSPTVNARDRIGKGPWQNIKGVVIANNLAELHGRNNLNKETALNERGEKVNGSGDTPNEHDILTGSDSEGRAFPAGFDVTCNNWTSNTSMNRAMVGHSDRQGGANTSWNSAHPSQGCSREDLIRTGGAGKFYCFAVN
jgi:hypothetical protein